MSIIDTYSELNIWIIPTFIKLQIEYSSYSKGYGNEKTFTENKEDWKVGRAGCLGRGILLAVTSPIIVIAAAVDALASAAFTLLALTATIFTLGQWRFAKTELVKQVVSTISCVFIIPAHILMTITAFLGVVNPNIYKYTWEPLAIPELSRASAYHLGQRLF